VSPRDRSQAQPRDQRQEPVRDGEKPLLQGHLKKKRQGALAMPEPPPARPAESAAESPAPATKGQRTRGKAETATRPHLEGSEQGPS
jgi:hypothetical protein